jgi:hypothetical protein
MDFEEASLVARADCVVAILALLLCAALACILVGFHKCITENEYFQLVFQDNLKKTARILIFDVFNLSINLIVFAAFGLDVVDMFDSRYNDILAIVDACTKNSYSKLICGDLTTIKYIFYLHAFSCFVARITSTISIIYPFLGLIKISADSLIILIRLIILVYRKISGRENNNQNPAVQNNQHINNNPAQAA